MSACLSVPTSVSVPPSHSSTVCRCRVYSVRTTPLPVPGSHCSSDGPEVTLCV